MIAGAYEVAGPRIPLVGGAAGGRVPAQLAGDGAHTDSVVAVAIVSPEPIGVGIARGCSPCAILAIVTRAAGRRLLQLDGRPAEQVYLEKLGHGGETLSDRDFQALAAVHPLGQPELRGDVRLRHVLGRSGDGGLVCATTIPPNAAILNKPGPLTEDEFAVIKRHPEVGEQILAPVPFLADVRQIVRHDHERWDGTGYPDGLRGPQIPIGARDVLVVDAWHAMISDRPYRRAMPEARAREELRANAGTQFDPDVVDALLRVLDRG